MGIKWNGLAVPVINKDTVYHIGTLNPEHRGHFYSESQEGHCLSVSTCPLAWRKIAKLGGNPLHEMNSEAGSFVDLYAIDGELKDAVVKWGIDEGLVEHKSLWQAWICDCENDSWGTMTFETQEAALDQLECDEIEETEGPDGGVGVVEADVLVGTDKLAAITLQGSLSTKESFDLLAAVWAERNIGEAMGVWWDEELDVYAYSAPKGGIFPGKVNEWSAMEISWNDAPEDEEEFEFSMH